MTNVNLAQVRESLDILLREATRAAEYEDLGGYPATAYKSLLQEVDATIGRLKAFRAEVQAIAKHEHQWNRNDYCSVCCADGRA